MKLAFDWRRILLRAWSLRLGAAAFVFGGAELLLPLFINDMPRHLFAVLSLIALGGSMWARLVRQTGFYK
jgi:hypothetical protein